MWLYRCLILLLMCVSLSVMAQTPEQMAAEEALMFERMEEASSSYLTQADVDVFIAVYKAAKDLAKTNSTKWKQIEDAPLAEKEKMISEVANLKPGESFVVSSFRIMMAVRASDPQMMNEAKQEYEGLKMQLPD